MRYVDFDSPELNEYPDALRKVQEGTLEPATIIIDGRFFSLWEIPYNRIQTVFEQMGAKKTGGD